MGFSDSMLGYVAPLFFCCPLTCNALLSTLYPVIYMKFFYLEADTSVVTICLKKQGHRLEMRVFEVGMKLIISLEYASMIILLLCCSFCFWCTSRFITLLKFPNFAADLLWTVCKILFLSQICLCLHIKNCSLFWST